MAERFPVPNAWAPTTPITPAVDPHSAPFELGPEWFGLDTLDVRGWGRLLARAWRELAAESDGVATTYLGAIGDPRLRAALAGHLAIRRGVRCEPESVAMTAGSIAAIAAIARTWLGPGRVCLVEDPGGEQLRRAIGGSGCRIVPVPVDDRGIRVDQLPQQADAILVTPSWQYPSGGSLSLARRLALLRWAADCGAIVIEDDCESELRYDGDPLPSLQGLAPDGRVIYVSTFSKVLFPGLRTGYMVIPSVHREPLLAAIEAGGRPPAAVEQRALAMLIENGGFDRHVRRLRTTYAARRDALVAALAEISVGLEVRRAMAGGHLILGIRDSPWTAIDLAAAVLLEGVRIEPLSANRMVPGHDGELVVYLSRLGASELVEAVRTIGRVMRTKDGPSRASDATAT